MGAGEARSAKGKAFLMENHSSMERLVSSPA